MPASLGHDGQSSDPAEVDLRRAREELARLADVERDLLFWRARAEKAEALAEEWRTVKNRSLWRIFAAVDQLRERVAPPSSRRERVLLPVARRAARAAYRARMTRAPAPAFVPSGKKDALFVYDEWGAGTAYRCAHQAEQLRYTGMAADVVRSGDVDLLAAIDHYEAFVLYRVEWTREVARFIDAAHREGRRVVFDTDDLIFEPELERHVPFLVGADEGYRSLWRRRMSRYRETLQACDRATVSTVPLAEHARRHAARVDVVYNAVSGDLVDRADEVLAARSYAETVAAGHDVVIGYLSGSPGHEHAFREAADALLRLFETHANVRLLLVGFLQLDDRFDRFDSRVTRIPKVTLEALSNLTSRVDINLAPFERDNPFTNCKTCVKYLEAGLVGVPTVASARPDFVRVIDHGRNGMLADTPSEWFDAMSELVESPARRRTIGKNAYDDVRQNHTTKASAPRLRLALEPRDVPTLGRDSGRAVGTAGR